MQVFIRAKSRNQVNTSHHKGFVNQTHENYTHIRSTLNKRNTIDT